jgi:2-polyprenyl-6-methoxyphenol hydroxylase-like FAD-dependent oxidoreductase
MRRVLIVGASIAGPALAWWLHRHGFAVTVVERAPALRAGGYKVDIRGAAIDVARSDQQTAFAQYERLMRPYVERNLKLGRDNLVRMVSKSALQSWFGAMMLRVMPKLPGKDAMISKLTQPIHDAARAIILPQY